MNRVHSLYRTGVAVLTAAISIGLTCPAYATNLYWRGGTGNWENPANWSIRPRGAAGNGGSLGWVPHSADVAILGNTGASVQIRSAVNLGGTGGIIIQSNWTGSLLQGTGTLTVGRSGISIGSGRFIGGNAAISSSGSYTQTGGIVSGIQNTFTNSGAFTITDGTSTNPGTPSFTATGTVVLDGQVQAVNVLASATAITTMQIASNSGTNLSSHLIVSGTFQVNTGSILRLGSKTLSVTGATFNNFGKIFEESGKIHHTATVTIADSTFTSDDSVTAGEFVYFSVAEGDENIDGTALDTFTITGTGASGDTESVTLTETTVSSGLFRGSLATRHNDTIVTNNSTLETIAASTMTARFTDAQDGLGAIDTATFAIPTTTTTTTTTTASTGGGGGRGGGGGGGGTTVKKTTTPPTTTGLAKALTKVTNPTAKNMIMKAQERRQKRIDAAKTAKERAKARAAKRKGK